MYKYSFPYMKVLRYIEVRLAYCSESQLGKTTVYLNVFLTGNGQWEPLQTERTAGITAFDILCVIGFECLTDFYNGTEALRPAGNYWE